MVVPYRAHCSLFVRMLACESSPGGTKWRDLRRGVCCELETFWGEVQKNMPPKFAVSQGC